jgi:DNA repair protein RecO (recombination protein O)
MEFTDDGVILSSRAHGETHALVDILTATHGRWAGLVYGGQGKRQQPVLQAGNVVSANWRGRLEDSLGHFTLELSRPRAAELMSDRLALAGLSAACAVATEVLPEREAHPAAYQGFTVLADHLEEVDLWPAIMARWEIGLLAQVGFGLTLDRCAASGVRDNLIYVSPKSACAVSAEAGEPYKDKLFPLPAFLRGAPGDPTPAGMIAALEMTGYFLETRALHAMNKGLPEARRRVIELLQRRAGNLPD